MSDSAEARNWAMACHLSAFVGFVGIPTLLGPLIVWLIKREEFPAVDAHGKEALNFNISFLIYSVISVLLIFVVVGFFLIFILAIAWLVLTIIAAIKAKEGEFYEYPFTIRFVK